MPHVPTPFGRPALDIAGGVIQQPLAKLTGYQGRMLFSDMSRDPVIGGLLLAVVHAAAAVVWEWEPHEESSGDGHTDFTASNFEMLKPGWPNLLIATLDTMLTFGFALYEPLYEADGNRVVWTGFSPRHPTSIVEWRTDPQTSEVTAAVQRTPNSGHHAEIPMQALLHYRTNAATANPEGRSGLLAAVKPWYFKSQAEELEAIGVERDNVGIPVIRVPAEWMSPSASPEQTASLEEFRRIGRNLRVGSATSVVLPKIPDPSDPKIDQVEFELLASPGTKMIDVAPIITRYNVEIAMSLLGDWLYLGHDKVGTQALSVSKIKLWSRTINAWLDRIAEVVSEQGAARLLALNGLDGPAPVLTHTPVRSDDLGAIGQYLAHMSAAGVWTPGTDDENFLRALAELPEVSDEALQAEAERETRMQEQMPTPPPGSDNEDF